MLAVVLGADCQGTLLYFLRYAEALAVFKSVRDSLSATVPTWTSSMSACYVTVIPRISGEDMSSAAAHSAISAHPGPRIYPKARAVPGPGGVIECLTARSDLRGE